MSIDEETLKGLIGVRGYRRGEVTKRCDYVTQNISTLVDTVKGLNANLLKDLKSKLDYDNLQIAQGLFIHEKDASKLQVEASKCDEYNTKLITTIHLLEYRPQVHASSQHGNINIPKKLKLPEVPLPEYSHKTGESLEIFIGAFEGVVDPHNISDFEKFSLLQKQLHGDPLDLIKSLQGANQSYDAAIKLLKKAFACTLTMQYEAIKRLSELKLPFNGNPYSFFSDMDMIIDSIDTLKIDVETFIQYFVWSALNDTLQQQLVMITSKNKPELKDIKSHYFEAVERFQTIAKKFNEKKSQIKKDPPIGDDKSVSVFAANIDTKVKSNFKLCSLCTADGKKDIDHGISRCLVYSNAKAKTDKIDSIGGCLKCGNTTHLTKACKFRFLRPCSDCRAWHFSFLCVGNPNSNFSKNSKVNKTVTVSNKNPESGKEETKNNTKINEVSNALAFLESGILALDNDHDNSILTTFSFYISDHSCRGLKDSGCQSNFILEDIAEKEKFKILDDNFLLKVNGFNTAKTFKTKIVEAKVKLGEDTHLIPAICIPTMNISLRLPGLSNVVEGFNQKGYTLADKFLLDKKDTISGIQFILGTCSSYCLPENEIVFGKPDPSSYKETKAGVMLLGNIMRLKNNLNYLPTIEDSESYVPPSSCENISELINEEFNGDVFTSSLLQCESSHQNVTETTSGLTVVDEKGNLIDSELQRATEEILNQHCSNVLQYERESVGDFSYEVNEKLTRFTLDSIEKDAEGRLIMPILWNTKVSHLLGKNFGLAKQILYSNLRKLKKTDGRLNLVDNVFIEQEKLGIIERIGNLKEFIDQKCIYSFLAHMPVFRPTSSSTKTRVVFLSNLCEKEKSQSFTVNHNQAMQPGMCLNRKITTALIQLRFNRFLLGFDIVKAFLQIKLNSIDQDRLLFLWFKNISKNDYEIVAYRNLRLPFGLKCSPNLLMTALYYILVQQADNDPSDLKNLKREIYNLSYMDNCSFSTDDPVKLQWACSQLESIFGPYKFKLQQFVTNNLELQSKIDQTSGEVTENKVKLLGLTWDRVNDTLSLQRLSLDNNADTKRKILSTVAKNFDLYNFAGPLLNRARLFLHELQCQKDLDWDQSLPIDKIKVWNCISKQVNQAPEISMGRFVGSSKDSYNLVAFTDSSNAIYGTVIYVHNLSTNEVNFLLAKNRIIGSVLRGKSIPSLEFQAIALGTEILIQTYEELTGSSCVIPLNIVKLYLYSDSLVCLNWLNSHVNKLEKMQKKPVFVLNRLESITKLCEKFPVTFGFCAGNDNPADCITRPLSYKQLLKTSYFSGPTFLKDSVLCEENILSVQIPNPKIEIIQSFQAVQITAAVGSGQKDELPQTHFFQLENSYDLNRNVRIQGYVLRYVRMFVDKMKVKNPQKFGHINILPLDNIKKEALKILILRDQRINFPEVFDYFSSKTKLHKDMPLIVSQLNVSPDPDGFLRVKSKFMRWKDQPFYFPILLDKNSHLTKTIILSFHHQFKHAGIYSLLSEIRKEFYITHYFSTVKKVLRQCIICKRLRARAYQINQSPYPEFRLNPPNIPFKFLFMDYFGPYTVNLSGKNTKVWILCICCLWSRAINLKIALDMTVQSFLRAFSLHCLEYGVPEFCLSDLGSNLTAGARIITDFLKDFETQQFFKDHNISPLSFQHYPKGRNELGSLVEICVGMTKQIIYKSIKSSILDFFDFEYHISNTVHLVNRRPIAFKNSLRDCAVTDNIPAPITPEILLRGHELVSINLLPNLHPAPISDPSWNPDGDPIEHVKTSHDKLNKARNCLVELYNEEFLAQLIYQATNIKDRYSPKNYKEVQVGDIVLLKEAHQKQMSYPLGIIKEIVKNCQGEVNNVKVLKGKTKEVVQRHITSLIPLISSEVKEINLGKSKTNEEQSSSPIKRPKRKAALKNQMLIKDLIKDSLL